MSNTNTSITCRDFVAAINEYQGGEMPAPRRERFAAHLSQCDKCSAYLKSYVRTVKLAKAAYSEDSDDPPDDLVRSIMASQRSRRSR